MLININKESFRHSLALSLRVISAPYKQNTAPTETKIGT